MNLLTCNSPGTKTINQNDKVQKTVHRVISSVNSQEELKLTMGNIPSKIHGARSPLNSGSLQTTPQYSNRNIKTLPQNAIQI